jgi:hypothetical protein
MRGVIVCLSISRNDRSIDPSNDAWSKKEDESHVLPLCRDFMVGASSRLSVDMAFSKSRFFAATVFGLF